MANRLTGKTVAEYGFVTPTLRLAARDATMPSWIPQAPFPSPRDEPVSSPASLREGTGPSVWAARRRGISFAAETAGMMNEA